MHMRLRTPLTLAALLVLTCSGALAQEEQQKDEQVIDDFVLTRGVSFEEPGKKTSKRQSSPPSRRNNKSTGGVASGKTPKGKGGLDSKSGKGRSEVAAMSANASEAPD